MSAKLIPLSKGKAYAIIDDEDFEYLNQWKWKLTNGRAQRNKHIGTVGNWRNGKRKDISVLMHREIMNAPKGMDVDHINHNQLDNRKSNLRVCTHQQNRANTKKPITNTTGYKGVVKDKRYESKYYVSITFFGKCWNFWGYDSAEEAALEYDNIATQLHGRFARLNFGGKS